MRLLFRAALFLLLALPLLAQTPRFGDPVPLTNARYENLSVPAKLVANGREVMLAWSFGSTFRMSPITGTPRIGRSVLEAGADVVWTGRHFVAVSHQSVRLLDSSGAPLGPATPHHIQAFAPRVATNGRTVAVLMSKHPIVTVHVLTLDGMVTDDEGVIVDEHHGAYAIASNGTGYAALTTSRAGLRLTLLDSAGAFVARQSLGGAQPGSSSIGSDGRGYLVAWTEEEGIRACFVREDGRTGATFPLVDGTSLSVSTIVWTGTRYAVVYTRSAPNNAGVARVQVAYVDAEGRIDPGTPVSTTLTRVAYAPSLAMVGGRLFASWSAPEGTVVREVARDGEAPQRAAWAALGQSRTEAIASADATLVVWREVGRRAALRFGIRGSDGSWLEDELPEFSPGLVFYASDGTDFLVIHTAVSHDGEAFRITRDGTMTRLATIPFVPFDVAWNGTDYVIVGLNGDDQMVAARLSPSGSLSATVVVLDHYDVEVFPQIASDGRGNVLIVWAETERVVMPTFPPPHLRGALLNASLQPVVPVRFDIERALTPYGAVVADVAWNGSHYSVVYSQGSIAGAAAVFTRGVSSGGRVDFSPTLVRNGAVHWITATAVAGGVAIVHESHNSPPADRIDLLDGRGRVTSLTNAPRIPTFAPSSVSVSSLPDGRLVLFHHAASEDAPYYGSQRIAMTFADPGVRPDAPVTAVARDGEVFRITWTEPPQPVLGFRVEHRLGNGDWIELPRSFTADEREATFPLPRSSSGIHSFRVRAWSERGMSGYSNEVTIAVPRRRAAR